MLPRSVSYCAGFPAEIGGTHEVPGGWGASSEFRQLCLSAALAISHCLPKSVVGANGQSFQQYSKNGDGMIFRWSGQKY